MLRVRFAMPADMIDAAPGGARCSPRGFQVEMEDRPGIHPRGLRILLRWMPGLHAMEHIVNLGPKADIRMAQLTMEFEGFPGRVPGFRGVRESRHSDHVAFCGRDSGIVPFAVRRGKTGLVVDARIDRRSTTRWPRRMSCWDCRSRSAIAPHCGYLWPRAISASVASRHKLARLADALDDGRFPSETPCRCRDLPERSPPRGS